MLSTLTRQIFDSICLSMLVLGTIGNILGLIVFSSAKFRRTNYGRLALLSLFVDLLCVYRYSLILHSTTRLLISEAVARCWLFCKFYRFSSCLRTLSALITVIWMYERFSYVTFRSNFSLKQKFVGRMKWLLVLVYFFLIVFVLTGPTVYFYDTESRTLKSKSDNRTEEYRNSTVPMCTLKIEIPRFWKNFFENDRFGLNYLTIRSILSEIIPSTLVFLFDIGIIIHVVRSSSSISRSSSARRTSRSSSYRTSILCRETLNEPGLIVHNRPRTSWMNIVLILHSLLFCFSSLTATVVFWFTSNPELSFLVSVVILANSSLNFYLYCLSGNSFRQEIRRLFYRYFQIYCYAGFLNLFRRKSQRRIADQIVRTRLSRHRSTILASTGHSTIRRSSCL